jgi:hypothetical protein
MSAPWAGSSNDTTRNERRSGWRRGAARRSVLRPSREVLDTGGDAERLDIDELADFVASDPGAEPRQVRHPGIFFLMVAEKNSTKRRGGVVAGSGDGGQNGYRRADRPDRFEARKTGSWFMGLEYMLH